MRRPAKQNAAFLDLTQHLSKKLFVFIWQKKRETSDRYWEKLVVPLVFKFPEGLVSFSEHSFSPQVLLNGYYQTDPVPLAGDSQVNKTD